MGGASRFILLLSTPFSVVHPRPSVFRLARHSLATLSTAPHFLITPSRTYRTTSLIPFIKPKASQPIHTQPNTVKEKDHFPCPEWYQLLDTLSAGGYFDFASSEGIGPEEDAYVAYQDLPQEFLRAARACLTFARNRSDILGSLSRRDIEVIVENGTPFLFKSALDTARRMRSFLHFSGTNVLESDKAQTVDLMKYLLSYASNPTVSSERNNLYCRELIESSVRNLLSELVEISNRVPVSDLFAPGNYQVSGRHGQSPRPLGQNIEMKRGDWICSKCSFMNFARNVKCLECEEHRPKRQITRGEWECPQCDFYNYGRNMVCLRCDCKRPGEAPFGTVNSTPELGNNNGDYASKADVDSRLAANEEKARRWFTKVSQSNNESDLSSAVTDEDFPEIMPSRKGVNRFVVSPRKTPLERRLANSQHQRNLGNKDGIPEGNNSQTDGANKTLDESIGRSLDQILGQTETVLATNEPEKSVENFQLSEKPASPAESQDKDEEEAKKSERWFQRVAELHDVKDMENAISDEDFPEIMPMRKGENRFVISKKKDRSLTSPMYKRQMTMEQASNTKFVPFVPFPPNYFAKKQQPDNTDSTVKSIDETSSVSVTPVRHPEKSDYNARIGATNMNRVQSSKSSVDFGEPVQNSKSFVDFGEPSDANPTQNSFNSQNISNESRSGRYLGKENNTFQTGPPISGSTTQNSPASQTISNDSWGSSYSSGKEKKSHQSWEPSRENPTQNSFGSQNIMSNENVKSSSGWMGKSLEGSAVKEPDPLDMSEEAKAERWFRRVAQIKDISELSQIPDEDFPSIMPMRKGVNRFVVSKRKTPMERRLTSPQYRRNLPVVTSDPPATNKENDNNS